MGGTNDPKPEEGDAEGKGQFPAPSPEHVESHFDMRKATFYLVAGVFAVNSVALFSAELHCLWSLGKGCWEGAGAKVADGFVSLLASALAFAAGQQGSIKKG